MHISLIHAKVRVGKTLHTIQYIPPACCVQYTYATCLLCTLYATYQLCSVYTTNLLCTVPPTWYVQCIPPTCYVQYIPPTCYVKYIPPTCYVQCIPPTCYVQCIPPTCYVQYIPPTCIQMLNIVDDLLVDWRKDINYRGISLQEMLVITSFGLKKLCWRYTILQSICALILAQFLTLDISKVAIFSCNINFNMNTL